MEESKKDNEVKIGLVDLKARATRIEQKIQEMKRRRGSTLQDYGDQLAT